MLREDFEERVMDLMQPLYYIACTFLPEKADREDALQNCLEKGLRKCASLRDASKMKPWITRILVNECHSLRRRQQRVIPMEEIQVPAPGEVDIELRTLVNALPTKVRLPLIMQLEGYTVAEITKILNVSEGTVKKRLQEAKHSLRDQLSYGEEVSTCVI